MTITTSTSADGSVEISLAETFDFNCVEDFRKAYESVAEESVKAFVIDFRSTHYMDSSALGMLINMQKYWEGRCSQYRIINANQQLKKIFAISRFDKKFTIE
ncbi:STAS domain-containing protein [Pseudomaricurvus alkylphenolicus]|uniref:STAS domain-containing protein n=1 Tax=Pseudomaricurvus alkylphenolicus TaxID=1306991 RepID=UPI0014206E58|nr:STAS domain-containing protein [Pseudomaricurvus alkylphenolicus]NIB43285.1 STAS domain-containing protein [Pseudomaricurvus alkylphenolicus]